MELEIVGEQIKTLFDNLCALFIDVVSIMPTTTAILSNLTSVNTNIIEYLTITNGVDLITDYGVKKYFHEAVGMLTAAVNNFITGFVNFISKIQSAALDHFPTSETLLPLDFIMTLVKSGFIVYDNPVSRILLGPVRVRKESVNFDIVLAVISRNDVYNILQPCFDMMLVYEFPETLMTIGSVVMREFNTNAAKKFVNDVFSNSSLR